MNLDVKFDLFYDKSNIQVVIKFDIYIIDFKYKWL